MVEAAGGTTSEAGAVATRIKYVVRGEKAVFNAAERHKSYWPGEEHDVLIRDMRPIADQLSFDRNGFLLVDEPSALTDFDEAEAIARIYEPETRALVQRLTGAAKVISFGTMIRTDDPATSDGKLPAFGAHVDYGARTVSDFTHDAMPEDEAARRLAGRHMLINVWRPIRTVERSPLALCDASTVHSEDLFESEVVGGLGDARRRSLYGFNLAWTPEHRWYYAPRMQPREAYVFKLFDSDPDAIQFSAHTAFKDPTSPPDAAPRLSIELRTIAYLDD